MDRDRTVLAAAYPTQPVDEYDYRIPRLPNSGRQALHDAFVLLTGRAPLHSPQARLAELGFVIEVETSRFEWEVAIDWAIGRFDAAGLELPAARISVAADKGRCGGNSGHYITGDVPEVRICVDGQPHFTVARLTLLHELGHLWAENRLSAESRSAFLETRGLSHWTSSDDPRHEWGAEHAAEVLSWGLMDEPVRIIRIDNASPEALGEAYVVLTGSQPLVEQ